jgi:hypothetical protein
LGYVYTIEPTLKNLGYHYIREQRNNMSPKKQALSLIPENAKEGIYHVWRHNQGYCEYLELFWK